MIETIDAKGIYLSEFERFVQDAAGAGPSWLMPLRRSAIDRFETLGFPTRRDEEWRFTNIAPLLETPFKLASFEHEQWMRDSARYMDYVKQIEPLIYPGLEANRLVLINGRTTRLTENLSSRTTHSPDVVITTLADALERMPSKVQPCLAQAAKFDAQPFAALNTAFLESGAFIYIPRNTVVEDPILLLFLSNAPGEPTVSHPRTLIVSEENSQATIIESYAGFGDTVYFTNAVTEIFAGENAVIDHYKVNRESRRAFHIANTQIELERSANFTSHSITLGGSLVRNDINAGLRGEGIECTLNGLYIGRDRQLIDNHTAIDHAMPHCESHELYKGILDGRAHGVFNGKIFVRQDAQKTDAKQTNQTLLLSDQAQINTKPQLEIFADDVKCTHGATVGKLSEEALFYVRTRGIVEAEARALLTYAFASDIVGRIKVEPVRENLDQAFTRLLGC